MPFAPPPQMEVDVFEIEGVTLLVFSWTTGPARTDAFRLTPAELDVLRGIAGGKGNAEIARTRGTSLRTIANQTASLFRKVGVCSRHELLSTMAASIFETDEAATPTPRRCRR